MALFAKDFIGVDLGAAYVDCAILEKKGKGVQLKDYFAVEKEAKGEERAQDQAKIAREFESRKLVNAKAAISLPDKNFLVITFKLPKLPPKEKEIAVRSEIEQKIPFPLDECAFDIVRLNPKEGAENDYVAFCTRISDVNRNHAIASNFTLMPERALTEMVANLNCAEFNGYMEDKSISYLLIDVGAMHVGFTLITNNLPWLTFCMAPKDSMVAAVTETVFDPKSFFEEQVHEVGKVISSFEEKSVVASIKKILLFGKAPLTELAFEKIPTITPIPIEKVDPIKNIGLTPKLQESLNKSLLSSVAIGLALTTVDNLEVKNVKT